MATNQMAEIVLPNEVWLLDPTSAHFNPDLMKLTGANSNGPAGPTRYIHFDKSKQIVLDEFRIQVNGGEKVLND